MIILGLYFKIGGSEMKCTIESLHMNVRCRILHIEGESYTLDMGGSSLWKVFFPFLYWMLPLDVYKVDDDEAIDAIVSSTGEQQGVDSKSLVGAVIALLLGNMIYPLIDYLDIKITAITSAMFVFVIFLLILALYMYANNLLGRKIGQQIQLEKLPKGKVWIQSVSKKYAVQTVFLYLFTLAFTVAVIVAVVEHPNGFLFFGSSIFMFMTLGVSFMTFRPGETSLRFENVNDE